MDPTPAEYTWHVDATPPEVTLTLRPPQNVRVDAVEVRFTSRESRATFTCRIDDATPLQCTSPYTTPSLADGRHVIWVRARDIWGNVGPPARAPFTVDTTPPDTQFSSGPRQTTSKRIAIFAFASSEAHSHYTCKLDETQPTPCESGHTTPALADGDHKFEVFAIDRTGNPDPSPATYGWHVDTVAPSIKISSGPTGTVDTTEATFAFASDDPTATMTCQLDDSTPVACESTYTTPRLADGPHVFVVVATDPAGNTKSDSGHWLVDSTPDH